MGIACRSPACWFFLAGSLILVALVLVPAMEPIHWVGGTDLEIEFIVTDAVTGRPINGATIKVKSQGGFCPEGGKPRFSLVTDADGSVKRLCKDCMCFGTSGWNIDTYAVHLPWWFYQVTAEGYSPTQWTELDVPENDRQVQRGKPAAKLVIRIKLEKAAEGQPLMGAAYHTSTMPSIGELAKVLGVPTGVLANWQTAPLSAYLPAS
jgi:hypothetical protein